MQLIGIWSHMAEAISLYLYHPTWNIKIYWELEYHLSTRSNQILFINTNSQYSSLAQFKCDAFALRECSQFFSTFPRVGLLIGKSIVIERKIGCRTSTRNLNRFFSPGTVWSPKSHLYVKNRSFLSAATNYRFQFLVLNCFIVLVFWHYYIQIECRIVAIRIKHGLRLSWPKLLMWTIGGSLGNLAISNDSISNVQICVYCYKVTKNLATKQRLYSQQIKNNNERTNCLFDII